jgi:hypothetical protein
VKGSYVADAHVKAIGSRNGDFISGETDLRGINIADGIKGTAMVIAQASDGRYAFYRGTQDIGPPPAPNSAPAQAPAVEGQPSAKGGKAGLLDDLQLFNKNIQQEQQKQLDNVYDNNINGGFGGALPGGVFKQ